MRRQIRRHQGGPGRQRQSVLRPTADGPGQQLPGRRRPPLHAGQRKVQGVEEVPREELQLNVETCAAVVVVFVKLIKPKNPHNSHRQSIGLISCWFQVIFIYMYIQLITSSTC